MLKRLRQKLGFRYSKNLEPVFVEDRVRRLYKPLLILLIAVCAFVGMLLLVDLFAPDLMAPPEYLPVFFAIHLAFFIFTLITLVLSVLLKAQFEAHPKLYFTVLNTYAVAICMWSSTLAAYGDYSQVLFSAYGYTTLILALILVLKPWQACLMFGGNYLYFLTLVTVVFPVHNNAVETLSNAAMATVFGIVIASALYALRSRDFIQRITVEGQLQTINEINADLLERVHIDGLTGLRNRRYFDEVLPEKIDELKRGQKVLCGMMFDIDGFKDYNDNYGHQAGDACLREVAQLVDKVLSARDTYLVRYGGEEFFVLAAVPDKQSGQKLAERIRARIEQAQIEHLAVERGYVTISIGLAFLEGNEDLELLTKYADEAVYEAKTQGRNRVAVKQKAR